MTEIGNITFNEDKTQASFSIKNVSEGSGTYVIWVYDTNPSRPIVLPKLSPGMILGTISNIAAAINIRPNGADAGDMMIGQPQGAALDDAIANSQKDMYGNCIPPYITSISPSSIVIDDVTSEEQPIITLTGEFDCVPFGNICEPIQLNASIQKVKEKGNENIECKTFAYIDITVKDSCVNNLEKFKLSGLTIKDTSNNIVKHCVTGQTYTGELLITNDSDDIIISSVTFTDNTKTQVFNVSGSKIGGGLFGGPRRLTFTFTPSCVFPSDNKQLSFNITVKISCNDGGTQHTKDIECGSIFIIAPVNCGDIVFTSYIEKPVLSRSNGSANCSSTYIVSCSNSMHITGVYIVKEVGENKIYASSVERFTDGIKFVFACLSNQYPEGEYLVYFETDIENCEPNFGTITVSGSNEYCLVIESLHAELLPSSINVSFTPKIPTGFTSSPQCETQSIRIDAFGEVSRQNPGYITDPVGTLSLNVTSGKLVSASIPITNMGGYDCSSVIRIAIITTGQSAVTCCSHDGGTRTNLLYNKSHSKSKIAIKCASGSSFRINESKTAFTFITSADYIPSSYIAKIYGTDPLSTLMVNLNVSKKIVNGLFGQQLEWTAYITQDDIKILQSEPDGRISFACLDKSTGKGECLYCNSSESKNIIIQQLGKVKDLWP